MMILVRRIFSSLTARSNWRQVMLVLTLMLTLTALPTQVFADGPTEGPVVDLPEAQRVFLTFMLAGSNISASADGTVTASNKLRLFDGAVNWLKRYYEAPEKTVTVNTREEMLDAFRTNLAKLGGVARDIDYYLSDAPITRIKVVGANPEIQQEIEKFLARQREVQAAMSKRAVEALRGYTPLLQTVSGGLMRIGDSFQIDRNLPPEQYLDTLLRKVASGGGALPNGAKIGVIGEFELGFEKAVQEINQIGDKIVNAGGAQMQNKALMRILQVLLGDYFKLLPDSNKRNIISEFMGGVGSRTDMERMALMFKHTGPQFQKFGQLLAREPGLNADFGHLLEKLESSVEKVPFSIIEAMIKADSNTYKFESIDPKPLGVGSMAQVHKAKMIHPQTGEVVEVVIRIVKPDAARFLQVDEVILRQIAPKLDADPTIIEARFPKIAPLVERLTDMAAGDMDIPGIYERQVAARQLYTRTVEVDEAGIKGKVNIMVPDVFAPAPNSQMLVQEVAKGGKMDAIAAQYPEVARCGGACLLSAWLQESMYGSGLNHRDMHRGNYLVRIDAFDPETKTFEMTFSILDLGMAGFLTRNQRQAILVLGVGAFIGDSASIAKTVWNLSVQNKNTISQKDLEAKISGTIAELRAKGFPLLGVGDWVAKALEWGIEIPTELVGFHRGYLTMIQSTQNLGVPPAEIDAMMENMGYKYKREIAKALVLGKSRLSLMGLMRLAIFGAKIGVGRVRTACNLTYEKFFTTTKPIVPPPVAPQLR